MRDDPAGAAAAGAGAAAAGAGAAAAAVLSVTVRVTEAMLVAATLLMELVSKKAAASGVAITMSGAMAAASPDVVTEAMAPEVLAPEVMAPEVAPP